MGLGLCGIVGAIMCVAGVYLFNNYPDMILKPHVALLVKQIQNNELDEITLRIFIDKNYEKIYNCKEVADFIDDYLSEQFKKHYFNKNLDLKSMAEIMVASEEPGVDFMLFGTTLHLRQYRKDDWIIITPKIAKMMTIDFDNVFVKNN